MQSTRFRNRGGRQPLGFLQLQPKTSGFGALHYDKVLLGHDNAAWVACGLREEPLINVSTARISALGGLVFFSGLQK